MEKEQQKEVQRRFGARLRRLRKERGLSQEAVALTSDLDRSYLGAIERNVSLVNIHRIALALQIEAAELLGD